MRRGGYGAREWWPSSPLLRLVVIAAIHGLVLCAASATGWPGSSRRLAFPEERSVIALAPLGMLRPAPGRLEHPINFGYRCTLVDAASVLDYYGADSTQFLLALMLSDATDYSPRSGPPWWAYVGTPGQRPLLDVAIERVGGSAGVPVRAQTHPGLNFARAVVAIAHDEPVILNVARTPGGVYNHSLLAVGFDTRDGHALLLVLDPNTQLLQWIGPDTLWSTTVTSTFIVPLVPPEMDDLTGPRIDPYRRSASLNGIVAPRGRWR